MGIDSLFPMLVTTAEAKQRAEQTRAAGGEGIRTGEFGGGIEIALVLEHADNPEVLSWIDTAAFDAIAAQQDPIALAISNLRKRTADPPPSRRFVAERNAWIVGYDDGFDTGRLLLHDVWGTLKRTLDLPGELLLRMPTRGIVFCCSNTPHEMALVHVASDDVAAQARARNLPTLFEDWLQWTPQGWAVPQF